MEVPRRVSCYVRKLALRGGYENAGSIRISPRYLRQIPELAGR